MAAAELASGGRRRDITGVFNASIVIGSGLP
jgi:hypothetical protein